MSKGKMSVGEAGRKGGEARAMALSALERSAIARKGQKASVKARLRNAKKKANKSIDLPLS